MVPVGVHFGKKFTVPEPVTTPAPDAEDQVALPAASDFKIKLFASPIPVN